MVVSISTVTKSTHTSFMLSSCGCTALKKKYLEPSGHFECSPKQSSALLSPLKSVDLALRRLALDGAVKLSELFELKMPLKASSGL